MPIRTTSLRLALLALACVATACGGRRATTPAPTPAPAPAPGPAPTPGAGGVAPSPSVGGPATGGDTAPSLWRISEPACPAGPSTPGAGAAGAPGDSARFATGGGGRVGSDPGTRKPALILRAAVAAREIRFASQPQITVRLCGGTLDSVRVIERRNLPRPVVAGTTYRDIFVAIEILGHLDAGCITAPLTGAGAGRAAGSCGSLSFTDSAGVIRGAPTPP